MRIVIKDYTFNKTSGTITFSDYTTITQENIFLIVDATNNTIIYQTNASGFGGTVSGNVLTLIYNTNTSAFNNTDKLQIFYEDTTPVQLVSGSSSVVIKNTQPDGTENGLLVRPTGNTRTVTGSLTNGQFLQIATADLGGLGINVNGLTGSLSVSASVDSINFSSLGLFSFSGGTGSAIISLNGNYECSIGNTKVVQITADNVTGSVNLTMVDTLWSRLTKVYQSTAANLQTVSWLSDSSGKGITSNSGSLNVFVSGSILAANAAQENGNLALILSASNQSTSSLFQISSSLSSLVGLNNIYGQKQMVSSSAVVIASDQTPISISTVSTASSFTPLITSGSAYTANQLCGSGSMLFTNVIRNNSGLLESIYINCKSVQTTGLKFYAFNSNPSSTTWNDKSAPSINAADFNKLIGVYSLSSPDSGLGTHTNYCLDGIGKSFYISGSTSLYGVLVVTGTPTFFSTSDLIITLNIVED